VAMAAGIACLKLLQQPGVYDALDKTSQALITGLKSIADETGIPVQVASCGAMLGMFFSDQAVTDFASAKKSDLDRFAAYYRGMLEQGIFLAPSQFEAFFVSTAHTTADIDKTLAAAKAVMAGL